MALAILTVVNYRRRNVRFRREGIKFYDIPLTFLIVISTSMRGNVSRLKSNFSYPELDYLMSLRKIGHGPRCDVTFQKDNICFNLRSRMGKTSVTALTTFPDFVRFEIIARDEESFYTCALSS